jgi:ABC-type transport system involved in cytochrome c biogenesis permease subunit
MDSLMTYMAAFGLAAGAGAKAVIPVLALGAFSYTPYFELSQRFAWIADPAVMVVLGVLVFVEILVDAHPELGRFSDVAAYLPKVVAGFLGFAAVTGTLDESLVQLGWRYRGRCPLAAQPGQTSLPRSR